MRAKERERGKILMVGWCGGECDGVFHQQLSMSPHPPVPHCRGAVKRVSKPVYSCELDQFVGVGM